MHKNEEFFFKTFVLLIFIEVACKCVIWICIVIVDII